MTTSIVSPPVTPVDPESNIVAPYLCLAGGDHHYHAPSSSSRETPPTQDILMGIGISLLASNSDNRVNAEREGKVGSSVDTSSSLSSISRVGNEMLGSSLVSSGKSSHVKDIDLQENWSLQDALKDLSVVNELYEERLNWVDRHIGCCPTSCHNALGKINVLANWVADLKEQNQALVEIIKDQDRVQRKVNTSKSCPKFQQQLQDQSLLINSMKDEIHTHRQTHRKLQLDKELALKSSQAWEASSRSLRKKLTESEAEVAKLMVLLTRIRDQCKWDVTDLEFSAHIHNKLFGKYPNLPGSTVISDTSLESASQASFLLSVMEKCAELEAAREELQLLRQKCETTEKLYQDQVQSSTQLAANFSRADILLKDYHNQIEELKGKIRVHCRIRPFASPADRSPVPVISVVDEFTVAVRTPKGLREFYFDRVFTPECAQDSVFGETKGLVLSAVHGYNVCIAAYGQTGSGKTFTIIGDTSHPGIAPRTCAQIFQVISERENTHDTVVSFYAVELYKHKLIDLLADPLELENESGGAKLEIRRDPDGIVNIQGCRLIRVENSGRLLERMMQALNSRHTSATGMNDRSSRSHLILSILIESTLKINGTVTRGKINLVDLAGSERQGKVLSDGGIFQESKLINKSLSALEHVIVALTTEQSHVPYRNNKLTELMQDSIGGNAKTLFFINVSPSRSNLDETLVSLNYGSRIKQVVNHPQRNNNSCHTSRPGSARSRSRRKYYT